MIDFKAAPNTVRVADVVLAADGWLTNQDIIGALPVLSEKTVRLHVTKLCEAGVVERVWLYPQLRYRWAENPDQAVVDQIDRTRELMAQI